MKTTTKVFLGVLASAILVGGLAALTRGFTNWEPSTWLDQWKGDPSDTGAIEANGVKLQVQGGPMFASDARAGDSKQITATITNADAMDKRVRWESSDPSKVSVGKSTTESGEANTIVLESEFEGAVTVYAYPELLSKDEGASVSITCDLVNSVQTLEAGMLVFTEEKYSGTLDLEKSVWRNFFDNAAEDEYLDYEIGWHAVKQSYPNFHGYSITFEQDEKIGVYKVGFNGSVTNKEMVYVMLKGVGKDGYDQLPTDDIGTVTATGTTGTVDLTSGIVTAFEGNELYVAFRIPLSNGALPNNWIFKYEVGSASFFLMTVA